MASSHAMNRRHFLQLVSALASSGGLLASCGQENGHSISGEFVGPSFQIGHLLREGGIPPPTQENNIPVVIIGGGVSGLCAAWKLKKAGFHDFRLFELESECGGNAQFGENRISAYPWGAHYLPIPTHESKAVVELLDELGVIQGYASSGVPLFREEYLCFDPQERLYLHGRWQEGLLPMVGATRNDLEEYNRFKDLILSYRHHRGNDGRKPFAIPMEFSSRDPDFLILDRISMHQYLEQNNFHSRFLHWYVNYACRDDFGTDYRRVSAWAGLHYFASRDAGEDEMENASVLTWPEGNGWIVRRLREKLKESIATQALVYRLSPSQNAVEVEVYHPLERRSSRVRAQHVIFASPRFLAPYLLNPREIDTSEISREFEYAPWMVANVSLKQFPAPRTGFPLAWDNVIYDSESLGYVVATHQSLKTAIQETVFTYYYAMTGTPASQERTRLLKTDWKSWLDFILRDLGKPHPEIASLITQVEVFRWGHAMIRPRPGFMWGTARQDGAKSIGNIHFAHSDLSGFSIFEEAQYPGNLAAEKILEAYRIPFHSSIV
ncbi:MAG: NAD(P)-binding protein [Terriglobia bacterium]